MSSVNTVEEPGKKSASSVKKRAPILNRPLDFISSVKFGVVLLCILVVLSILGMLIIQQNVNGFDAYYAGLTPAEKTVFGSLLLFDIYHSWYFNILLLVLSLNIVLASIDRFPSAWSYIVKPKLTASAAWLEGRMKSASVKIGTESALDAAKRVAAAMKRRGLTSRVVAQSTIRIEGPVTSGWFAVNVTRDGKKGQTGPIEVTALPSEIRAAFRDSLSSPVPVSKILSKSDYEIAGTLESGLTISVNKGSGGESDIEITVDNKEVRGGGKIGVSSNESYAVFGESGRFNRLGAYIVHVALLTLFLGHFVALQTGFDADVGFQPGQTTNEIELIQFDLDQQNRFAASLPFSITCTDIQQKLIDPNGSIETFNTLDWVTSITIDDPSYGITKADVGLNRPFSYRGYRFFQAQTVPIGNARKISLSLTPEDGSGKPVSVEISRNGSATLKDGTLIKYEEFLPDFTFNQDGQPDTRSGDYNNPAAVLSVTPKNDQPVRVYAFATNISDDMPVGAAKAGFKWKLESFEKSPRAHILSIKYDPYNGAFIAWYFGGIGLIFALMFVFFISHRRVWALIREADFGYEALIGGETNRNHQGFEERFDKLAADIGDAAGDNKDRGE